MSSYIDLYYVNAFGYLLVLCYDYCVLFPLLFIFVICVFLLLNVRLPIIVKKTLSPLI